MFRIIKGPEKSSSSQRQVENAPSRFNFKKKFTSFSRHPTDFDYIDFEYIFRYRRTSQLVYNVALYYPTVNINKKLICR